ncbi:MAG: tyrosine-type recombinase/integrase, partial [Nitrososphaeraceae archaeon]
MCDTNIMSSSSSSVAKYKSHYSPFEKFINSLHSKETARTYTSHLKSFLTYANLPEFDKLLELDENQNFDLISDYIVYLRNESKLSGSSINIAFSAIKRFYKINRVTNNLDWEQLMYYKGKNKGKVVDDRTYTKDEIKLLLDHSDLRLRVVILTLLSTGMRIGGLAALRMKDLEYIEQYKIYKFKVYNEDDLSERYITFCTTECASTIKRYLEYRVNQGDTLKPDSPFIFRRKLTNNQYQKNNNNNERVINEFDKPLDSGSLQQAMGRLQIKSNVVTKISELNQSKKARIRKPMMRCHSFRKMFNTVCIENNVNHYIKEKLLGHKKSLELDFNYFRPSESQLLTEYLKVVDSLTINDENRLSMQIQELKEKDDYQKYVIDKKIQEKDEQINLLVSQVEKLNNETNRNRQEFIDIA